MLNHKTEIPHLIDINLVNMKMNKFLFSLIVVAAVAATPIATFAQIEATPPPLEKPTTTEEPEAPIIPTLGKITIQISQTEQIIIDLPLKTDSKYQVVPIK